MKKLLSTIMALVMLLSLVPMAVATEGVTEENAVAQIGDQYYKTLEDAVAAVPLDGTKTTITLVKDVALGDNGLKIGSVGSEQKVLTLDLNGHSISATDSVIMVQNANLTVTGPGKIYETSPYYGAILINGSDNAENKDYTVVTVGAGVELEGWSPIFVNQYKGCAYGVVVNVDGAKLTGKTDTSGDRGSAIYVNGTIKDQNNAPKLVLNDVTQTTEGTGMYLAGYANTTITGGSITGGNTGIEIRAGELTVNGATVVGNGVPTGVTPNGNGSTTDGAGIAVAQHTTKLPIKVTINSGDISGYSALYQSNPEKNDDASVKKVSVAVNGGTFKAINGGTCGVYSENNCVAVTGGTFTDLASAVKYATDGATITLAEDVALTSPVTVDKALTIDMNGYNITANGCRALHQKQGTLNIIGKGTIAANSVKDNSSSTIRVGDNNATNTANFTLGKDVTVTSDSCYGITYFGMKNETLTINGTVAVTGDATALSGNGSSNYKDVNVSVTVNGTVTAERANAIYKPEKGTLTINGVVKGVGGIEVKSGTLAIGANAEVTATAEATSHSVNRNGCSTSGYALAAVANKSYQDDVNITVSGGKVIGQVAKVVDDADAPEGKLTIEGGTFTVNPSTFLADKSLIAVPSKGGVYVVQPKEITVGDTTTKVDVSNDGKTVTETKTENKNEGNVATRTETVTVKDNEGNVTKATETVTTEKTENGGKTTVVTEKDTLNKTETTEVTGVTAPTTASDVRLDVKNTTNVAVNKASMAALKGDNVKDVVIETKQATLKLNKTAVETMENNVAADGKMTLNVTVTENTAKEVTVKVEAKTQGDKNVFPPETKNTNGEIEITIPYTGTATQLDLWYTTDSGSIYMGRFPVVNGYVSFKVTHFSQYNLIPVASSGSSVIKTGAGSSAASTTQTVTTDLTPGSITKVTVDGKVVDAKYYTVSGSNVTFTAEFLKTLKNGSHTVTVENATKIAKGVFTVNNPTSAVQAPTTADAGIALYAGMAIASVMGTGVVFTSRKRKNH